MQAACETVEIVNKRGLHARASAKFVNLVAELPADLDVRVVREGTEVAGGSILGLMMLGAAKGSHIDIHVSGDGAQDALARLAGLVKDGFGEE